MKGRVPSYLKTIEINPPTATLDVGQQQIFEASGWDQYRNPFLIEQPDWETSGGGDLDIDGLKCTFKAVTPGEYTLKCRDTKTGTEGSAEINIPSSVVGRLVTTVKPVAWAGTATPGSANGRVGDPVTVKATPNNGWIFSHWVNASPPDQLEATAVLGDPATQVEAWFKPILTLSVRPDNPGYQAVCPPDSPEGRTNTPIIQIKLTASEATTGC